MKIQLSQLHPNPFRDLKRLPVKPEKVEILKESIKETSFWAGARGASFCFHPHYLFA